MVNTCCVFNCKNSLKNSKCEFYKFPKVAYKINQKNQWIAFVQRNHPDGSKWILKPHHVICSEHFVGNKKSDCNSSPNYAPSIFSKNRNEVSGKLALNRHARYLKRRISNQMPKSNVKKVRVISGQHQVSDNESFERQDNIFHENYEQCQNILQKKTADVGCQAEIVNKSKNIEKSNSFTCIKYIYSEKTSCDVEIQTNLIELNKFEVNPKIMKNKCVETCSKSFCDKEVICNLENERKKFSGYESIKNEKQLKHTAGITVENFEFLLKGAQTATIGKNCKVLLKDRLFIFLIVMKTGLSFAALSVFFSVSETTISRIFFSLLHYLSSVTSNLVFWPDKKMVQSSMPECFKPQYANTRVIIDCTEFKIEIPNGVSNKVLTYSHYKKGFTAKVLIGITPSGFICFKSKVTGGRKTDSNMTIESQLIDLLEDGDEILADKGFPEITAKIDEAGKKVLLVMPPFLVKKNEFSEEERAITYNVAKVRIHVERIMQRLRTYKILQFVPEHLFSSIDDILHMACVLVNLQPLIISGIEIN